VIILGILGAAIIIGWLANFVMGGGTKPADWGPVLAAGLLGSVVGGTVLNLITGDGFKLGLSGLLGSVFGAVIVLAGFKLVAGRKAKSAAKAAPTGRGKRR
jgi:uncharacterized membrane protein YeaQ/YmgE (transglycosylase-associated protein family)